VKDYSFFGVPCGQVQFAVYLAEKTAGVCPFCKRTGLTPNYGSDKKHIKACAKVYLTEEREDFHT
jgi:hypothetical protein